MLIEQVVIEMAAVRLNIGFRNDGSCVADAHAEGDRFLREAYGKSTQQVQALLDAYGAAARDRMRAYNEGRLCVPPRPFAPYGSC